MRRLLFVSLFSLGIALAQKPKDVRLAAKPGASAIPVVAQYLNSTDADTRVEVVKQLIQIGGKDIIDPLTNNVLVARNTLIEESEAELVEKAGVEAVLIRSVLTCDSAVGVCAKCYGRSLATGKIVDIGEAVEAMRAHVEAR